MSIELVLYLIDFLGNLDSLFGILFFLPLLGFGIALFVGAICCIDSPYEFKETFFCKTLLVLKSNIGWLILLGALNVFIPSQKTMYLMIGANYFKNSSLPPKVEAVIEKKLDEYLNEAVDGKKENK